MFRLTKLTGERDGTFGLPYNDGPVSDYCFFNIISETGDASELAGHARRLGFTPSGDAHTEGLQSHVHHGDLKIVAALPIANDDDGWRAIKALGWVEIPSARGLDSELPIRDIICPLTDAEAEEIRCSGMESDIGVDRSGEDTEGKAAVILSGWEFYHILPLRGYTWQSYLTACGVEGDEPEPFGFFDDSDMCGECCAIDSRDDGYNYNFRETPSGNYVGVNCGCYAEACRSEWPDLVNDAGDTIGLDLARDLARDGKLKFLARYIGGMVDVGRGGFFMDHGAEDGAPDAKGMGPVRNGQPDKILAELRAAEPDGEFIFSLDETGQFQTYFSVWRVLAE